MAQQHIVKKWSNEEEQDLVKEIESNMEDEEIAKKHQRSVGAIKIRQRKIAVKMLDKGDDMEVIVEKLKLPAEVILEQKKIEDNLKKNPPQSDKKIALIKKKLQEIQDML